MNFLDHLTAVALPGLFFYFFFWRPFRRVRDASSWRETPCVVLSSSVNEDATDSGLYNLLVTYQYEVAGRSYNSSRYNFSIATATCGYAGKKRVVDHLELGAKAVCYVNPDDPRDAVIERGMTWDMAVSALFAIACWTAFAIIGM